MRTTQQMSITLPNEMAARIKARVASGEYASESEVIREGLRLVEERETKLAALRETIETSLARGGENTDDDVDRRLEKVAEGLMSQGY